MRIVTFYKTYSTNSLLREWWIEEKGITNSIKSRINKKKYWRLLRNHH